MRSKTVLVTGYYLLKCGHVPTEMYPRTLDSEKVIITGGVEKRFR